MQSVAEYINEMQKVIEDFGEIFEELAIDMKSGLEELEDVVSIVRLKSSLGCKCSNVR